jgi:hypothetical protein
MALKNSGIRNLDQVVTKKGTDFWVALLQPPYWYAHYCASMYPSVRWVSCRRHCDTNFWISWTSVSSKQFNISRFSALWNFLFPWADCESLLHWVSPGCGWIRRPPDAKGSFDYRNSPSNYVNVWGQQPNNVLSYRITKCYAGLRNQPSYFWLVMKSFAALDSYLPVTNSGTLRDVWLLKGSAILNRLTHSYEQQSCEQLLRSKKESAVSD